MSNRLPRQKKLVPISEAAKVLGVSIDTVRRWDKSGVLHSERMNGKNRYFSLGELERYQLNQPLSISEVAKELGISATTVRRLETRGLIKPNRNKAGERIFDRESIEKFLNSGYFLRKKQVKEKNLQLSQEEVEIQSQTIPNKTLPLEKSEAVSSIKDYPPEAVEPAEEIPLHSNSKLLQTMSGLLAAAVIFILLTAIGITNIQASTIKAAQPLELSPVVSDQVNLAAEAAPDVIRTETVSTASANPSPEYASASVSADASASAGEEKPNQLQKVKINSDSSIIDIRQTAATDSGATPQGELQDDSTLEIVSVDSKGYHVKLSDGSTGFIPLENINKEEVNQ